MSATLDVFWSPLAEETYLDTIEFILEIWTLKEAIAFDKKVESLLSKLKTHKKLCPPSETKENIRRCVISEQTSLVYQIINDSTIELVAFYDNRSSVRF